MGNFEIRHTLLDYLVYGTMTLYTLAALLFVIGWLARTLQGPSPQQAQGEAAPPASRRLKLVAWIVYGIGFHLAMMAFAIRWSELGYAPLRGMFNVFLAMAMLMFPLSLVCRRYLKVGGEWFDALVGAALLFPVGLVWSGEAKSLPPALQSWLFIPHVATYLVAYVILAKAALHGLVALAIGNRISSGESISSEQACYRMVSFGFPVLTLGLVLGAWWGKLAWGDYWNWDPKELWSLITWFCFVGYLHVRYMFGRRYPRLNGGLAVVGMIAVVLTLWWVGNSSLFAGGVHNYGS